jgi:hypothetical protein
MAKYLVKEDYEVAWVRPTNGTTANAIFKKDSVIEAAISPVDGALVTRVDGAMPSFKDGEVIVKVNEQKVELIPDKSAEDLAKKQAMMKWIYLGGTAVLLWWFVYGREKKKKYSETSAGYAGVKGGKSTKGHIYEYIIPSYALPYLVNNDPSGLSDEEIKKIDKFADEVYKETGASLESGIDYDQEPYFKWRNDIDGSLGSNVIDVKVISKK